MHLMVSVQVRTSRIGIRLLYVLTQSNPCCKTLWISMSFLFVANISVENCFRSSGEGAARLIVRSTSSYAALIIFAASSSFWRAAQKYQEGESRSRPRTVSQSVRVHRQ